MEKRHLPYSPFKQAEMKKYLSLFRIRFINSLQYRVAALAGVFTQFAWGFMEILAFLAFYKANPADFPMSMKDTATYIWLQQAFLAIFMMWFFDDEIFSSISSGGVAYEMVRPIDLYNRWFVQNVANRTSKALLRCIPIFAIAFFLPENMRLSLPPNAGQFILFLISFTLGLGLVVAFSMFIYIGTIYTLSPMGLRMVAIVVSEFLSGAVLPLPFFPEKIQRVINLLPFASMQNMPLRIYSGNISGPTAYRGLLLQLFWLAFMLITGKLFMKRALKKVIIQGG